MSARLRVLVAGATGYIGRRVTRELVERGHEVVALARTRAGVGGAEDEARTRASLAGAEVRFAEVTDRASLAERGVRGERFDAVVSCLATRSGAPDDAWRIEHVANRDLLEVTARAGVGHFVLLSAICVQRPRLAFQHAKLAFETDLARSEVPWTVVRPTAFFKSLSGQLPKVKAGRPFVVFGDGTLTRCKPISERDLAVFLADCLLRPERHGRILPIGGPGPAVSPREQGEMLFELLGRPPRFRSVPTGVLDAAAFVLALGGRVVPTLAEKAELARIGRYYATESMLVWNADEGAYDEHATPSFGQDVLRDFYARALSEGLAGQELGDHAVF